MCASLLLASHIFGMALSSKKKDHFNNQKRFHLQGPPPCGVQVVCYYRDFALQASFCRRFRSGGACRARGVWVLKMRPLFGSTFWSSFSCFLLKYKRIQENGANFCGHYLAQKVGPRSVLQNQKTANMEFIFVGVRLAACSREPARFVLNWGGPL